MHMNRTTILLPAELRAKASAHARQKGISLGELIRRSLEAAVSRRPAGGDMLLADRAVYSGDAPADLSERHDDHLYGTEG